MISLLLDKDVLTFLFVSIFLAVVYFINHYRKKYEMNWRRWMGAFLTATGLASYFTDLSSGVLTPSGFAKFVIIITGLILWLYRPRKIKNSSRWRR